MRAAALRNRHLAGEQGRGFGFFFLLFFCFEFFAFPFFLALASSSFEKLGATVALASGEWPGDARAGGASLAAPASQIERAMQAKTASALPRFAQLISLPTSGIPA